jgi:Zn-dependent M32 family carboxypeptidase
MKICRAEIQEQYNKLVELTSVNIPARAAIRLGEILDELKEQLTDFKKRKMALIEKYRDKDDPDGYNREIVKLLFEEIELKSKPIPEECLDDVSLTLAHARNLWKFVQ